MFVVTHAAVPIIAYNIYSYFNIRKCDQTSIGLKIYSIIGLSGILPDILDPHIDLDARMKSWSHTVWFLVGFSIILVISSKAVNIKLKYIIWVLFGVFAHDIFDAISGGISPLYPYQFVIGDYYIKSDYWITIDAVSFIFAIITTLVLISISQMSNQSLKGSGQ
jgi:hypothetical protein